MARDPEQDSPIVFDLVDDAAADPGAPHTPPHIGGSDGVSGSDGAASGSDEAPVPAAQSGRWRVAAPVAAVLAIVLGTGIASDGARESARIERMRDVLGGVADLSVPLEETWAWEGAVGARQEWFFAAEAVAVLDDVLVFESDGELVALEPATGEEAWAVQLGDDPDCGPLGVSPYGGTPMTSTPVVVCLQGTGADREAIAVTPDGTVSAGRAQVGSEPGERAMRHQRHVRRDGRGRPRRRAPCGGRRHRRGALERHRRVPAGGGRTVLGDVVG
jgi:hypothetical protein